MVTLGNTNSQGSGFINKGWKKLASLIEASCDAPSEYGEFTDAPEETKTIETTISGNDGRRQTVQINVAQDTDQVIEIRVPEGVRAGEQFQVVVPGDGRKLRVRIPNGVTEGDIMFVPVPKKEQEGFFSKCKKMMDLDLRKSKSCP